MMKINAKNNIPGEEWDHHIAKLGGNILQSRAWALFQWQLGRSTYYAYGNDWAYLAQLRVGRGIKYLYVAYGPVARTAEGMSTAIRSLMQRGRDLGIDFLRLEPVGPIPQDLLAQYRSRAIAEIQPQRTLILNLTKSEAGLRAGISQSNRNLINTAAQRGIRCHLVARPGDNEYDQFIAMLHDTAEHDKFRPYEDNYYRQTMITLGHEGKARLYLAYANAKLVAGAIVFDFAKTRYYAHAAAFQDLNRQYKAAAPLLWQIILEAKAQGMHYFDFWGIAPTDDPSHPRAGLTRFKRSFGGQVKQYNGAWDLPMRPAKYQLYRIAKAGLR